jgi:hypothetical protein
MSVLGITFTLHLVTHRDTFVVPLVGTLGLQDHVLGHWSAARNAAAASHVASSRAENIINIRSILASGIVYSSTAIRA